MESSGHKSRIPSDSKEIQKKVKRLYVIYGSMIFAVAVFIFWLTLDYFISRGSSSPYLKALLLGGVFSAMGGACLWYNMTIWNKVLDAEAHAKQDQEIE